MNASERQMATNAVQKILQDAFQKHGSNYQQANEYTLESISNNKEIVLDSVKDDGDSLKFASNDLKDDIEIVLAAVNNDGLALQYASTVLMDNKEIALAAVQQNGRALQYASERIKNNKEVVLAAVQQNGWAVEYASEHLKDDATVFKAATKAVLNKLGASAEADEADAVRAMSFAFLARVFKHNDKFVEEARAASAAFEHPGEKDRWTTARKRDRSAYEAFEAHA
jgi:hypoxanthine phosphoribosyltransferase